MCVCVCVCVYGCVACEIICKHIDTFKSVFDSKCIILPVQVIVEKVPKSSIPDIDKKKFLVPADLSGKSLSLFPSLLLSLLSALSVYM